jgi:hypothetical protein
VSALITPVVILVSDLNPSTAGQIIHFTATVSSPGNPTPTGSITVSEDLANRSIVYGSSPLKNGVGIVSTDQLTPGRHQIRATYGGDNAIYTGAASDPLEQVVNVSSSQGGSFTISGPSRGVVGLPAGTFTITPLDRSGRPLSHFHATVPVTFKGPGNVDRTALIIFVDGASKAVFTSAFPQTGTYTIHASYRV